MIESMLKELLSSAPGLAGTVLVCWMFVRYLSTVGRDMTQALGELTAELRDRNKARD